MYALSCDGVRIAQTGADDITFESGTLMQRVSAADVLTCTLVPENPYKNYVALRSSILTLERLDGQGVWSEIFRGQAIHTGDNENGFFQISGLGDMSFLHDIMIEPFTYTGTLAGLLDGILSEYSSNAPAKKKIYKGTVTVSGSVSGWETTSYKSAWDLIQGLVDDYGGALFMRYLSDGTRGLDWLADVGRYASQPVVWGDNLLSVEIENDASDVVNTLVAEGENSLIRAYSDADSVAQFGPVYGYQRFSGISNVYDLKNAADAALAKLKNASRSVAGRAIDKYMQGLMPFKVGDFAEAISKVHLLDEWILVSELKHDLTGKSPLQVTLGRIGDSMTASNRTKTINTWIKTQQGTAPPRAKAIDANEVYAVDAGTGDYAVAMQMEG